MEDDASDVHHLHSEFYNETVAEAKAVLQGRPSQIYPHVPEDTIASGQSRQSGSQSMRPKKNASASNTNRLYLITHPIPKQG
jgi:hypothetical protein